MGKNFRYPFLYVIGLFLLISGCTSTMSLRYSSPPAATDPGKGNIYVYVDDQRSPERGGKDPTIVGTVRNTFGMPFPLKSSSKREPAIVIRNLVSDCLRNAGYNVVSAPEKGPVLLIELKAFWSDGYQHSRIWSTLPTQLKKNQGSKPIWQHQFESNVGVTWSAGYGPFDKGINRMLEELKKQMISVFSSKEFGKSYQML